jgi:anion-transporting  ArsA/GET3 family ATPase
MLDRRLLFIAGKGGVGKSAVTASLAILAARRGMRVLAIEMVDGVGLASHFTVDRLAYSPMAVRPGVDAIAISRAAALDEYLRLQLRVPRAAPTRMLTRALNVLVETAPGIREVVSIGKPVFEMWQGKYDIVVVDAPPLGQLQSYLRAPSTIADLVPAGPIRSQATRMQEALTDEQTTGLLLVSTPEELPVLESLETLDALADDTLIPLSGVALNRVLAPIAISEEQLATLPPGPHREAASHHVAVFAAQRQWAESLPHTMSLPYLFGLRTPGEVAEQLSDEWDDLL